MSNYQEASGNAQTKPYQNDSARMEEFDNLKEETYLHWVANEDEAAKASLERTLEYADLNQGDDVEAAFSYMAASILNRCEEYQRALAFADRGVQLTPNDVHLQLLKGTILSTLVGQYSKTDKEFAAELLADCRAAFKTATEVAPDDETLSHAYGGWALVMYMYEPKDVAFAEQLAHTTIRFGDSKGLGQLLLDHIAQARANTARSAQPRATASPQYYTPAAGSAFLPIAADPGRKSLVLLLAGISLVLNLLLLLVGHLGISSLIVPALLLALIIGNINIDAVPMAIPCTIPCLFHLYRILYQFPVVIGISFTDLPARTRFAWLLDFVIAIIYWMLVLKKGSTAKTAGGILLVLFGLRLFITILMMLATFGYDLSSVLALLSDCAVYAAYFMTLLSTRVPKRMQ